MTIYVIYTFIYKLMTIGNLLPFENLIPSYKTPIISEV